MKNPTLSNLHPDDVALDRLRAGLLEDDAARTHIETCAVCQQRLTVWNRLANHLQAGASSDNALARQLRERRRATLAGQVTGHTPSRRRWTPQYLAMAAAVATLAIGLGVFVTLDRLGPDTAPDAISAQAEGTPDIYADIEFYLWLTTEGLGDNTSGNAS